MYQAGETAGFSEKLAAELIASKIGIDPLEEAKAKADADAKAKADADVKAKA
ncbi:MAG TPA: cell envelope integrity protein TolA, partial [Roseobacter sp.]|nr:cell envelope integrity protein TolA [Roseobacter sp.]